MCPWQSRREKADVYWNFLMTVVALSAALAHFEHSFMAKDKPWKILLEVCLAVIMPAYVLFQVAVSILITCGIGLQQGSKAIEFFSSDEESLGAETVHRTFVANIRTLLYCLCGGWMNVRVSVVMLWINTTLSPAKVLIRIRLMVSNPRILQPYVLKYASQEVAGKNWPRSAQYHCFDSVHRRHIKILSANSSKRCLRPVRLSCRMAERGMCRCACAL